jgi:methyl-accepting chemotaxis protein
MAVLAQLIALAAAAEAPSVARFAIIFGGAAGLLAMTRWRQQVLEQSTAVVAEVVSGQEAAEANAPDASSAADLPPAQDELSLAGNGFACDLTSLTVNLDELSESTESIIAEIATLSSSAEEMSVNMASVNAAMMNMSMVMTEVADTAQEGNQTAGEAVEQATSASQVMMNLGEAAKDIGAFTEVIQRIARQTNLLALNATIEAASAGEAGRGFSVVASEIKELAAKSAEAASDIAQRIEGIQSGASEAVQVTEGVVGVIGKINDAVSYISEMITQQSTLITQISASTEEASTGVNDMARGVAGLARHGKTVRGVAGDIGQAVQGATASAAAA